MLEIPPGTLTESYLRVRGYSPIYTRGMEEIEELIAVGKQLRKVNPYETHVPYLGRKLREYIVFMETGITNSRQQGN